MGISCAAPLHPEGYGIEAVFTVGKRGDQGVLPEGVQARETPSGRLRLAQLASKASSPVQTEVSDQVGLPISNRLTLKLTAKRRAEAMCKLLPIPRQGVWSSKLMKRFFRLGGVGEVKRCAQSRV